jgi:hypothetical protein
MICPSFYTTRYPQRTRGYVLAIIKPHLLEPFQKTQAVQSRLSVTFSKDAVHSPTVVTSFAKSGQISFSDASLPSWENPAVQLDLRSSARIMTIPSTRHATYSIVTSYPLIQRFRQYIVTFTWCAREHSLLIRIARCRF